jgi:hypothetical protein
MPNVALYGGRLRLVIRKARAAMDVGVVLIPTLVLQPATESNQALTTFPHSDAPETQLRATREKRPRRHRCSRPRISQDFAIDQMPRLCVAVYRTRVGTEV